METMHQQTARLSEYEKEKELSKIRSLLIDRRMVQDSSLPKRRTVRTLVEVGRDITRMSPEMQKALNFEAIRDTVVKRFDFEVRDVVNYMLGRKELLFSKLRVVDPERFREAQAESDMSVFTHQEVRPEAPEDTRLARIRNKVRHEGRPRGMVIRDEVEIEKKDHKQLYLTDGFLTLDCDYDYVEDLKYKGIPFESRKFQELQYLLYNGINQKEFEFRQVFLRHLIEDFEKDHGPLTWAQRSNIVAQFEEEIFEDFDHIQRLEDVLENLEQDLGLYKKFKKEVSIDWVDQEIKRAREFYVQLTPQEARRQREFVEAHSRPHRRFLQIGRSNVRRERPRSRVQRPAHGRGGAATGNESDRRAGPRKEAVLGGAAELRGRGRHGLGDVQK